MEDLAWLERLTPSLNGEIHDVKTQVSLVIHIYPNDC
jgi:hypothetical protein